MNNIKKFLSLFFIIALVVALTSCDFFNNLTLTTASITTNNVTTATTNGNTTSSTTGEGTVSTTTKATTTTTTTETTTTDSTNLLNFYKQQVLNYTYYDLGQDSTYFDWHYINSIGTQKILVIPVKISGYESTATSETLSDIQKVFFGNASDTYWESVSSYYYTSSYGKLNFTGTVMNVWLGPISTKEERSGHSTVTGVDVATVLADTASYLKDNNIDTTQYDSDKDGYIDLVWYVFSAPDYQEDSSLSSDFWAFTSAASFDPSTTSPVVNNYCWASYDFMYEAENYYNNDSKLLNDVSGVDAHTYIHETGHALGLDDYYNADDEQGYDSVENIDMMSANVGDQDAFSKLALGWVLPYVVYGNSQITILDFESSGDCIVLPLSWDGNAFGEYLIFQYYTPTGLNATDYKTAYTNGYQCPSLSGVIVYHVDARLCYTNDDKTFYVISKPSLLDKAKNSDFGVAYSNTPSYAIKKSDLSSTANYLISVVDRTQGYKPAYKTTLSNSSLFIGGTTLSTKSVTLHTTGASIDYTVTFSNNASGTGMDVKFIAN